MVEIEVVLSNSVKIEFETVHFILLFYCDGWEGITLCFLFIALKLGGYILEMLEIKTTKPSSL